MRRDTRAVRRRGRACWRKRGVRHRRHPVDRMDESGNHTKKRWHFLNGVSIVGLRLVMINGPACFSRKLLLIL